MDELQTTYDLERALQEALTSGRPPSNKHPSQDAKILEGLRSNFPRMVLAALDRARGQSSPKLTKQLIRLAENQQGSTDIRARAAAVLRSRLDPKRKRTRKLWLRLATERTKARWPDAMELEFRFLFSDHIEGVEFLIDRCQDLTQGHSLGEWVISIMHSWIVGNTTINPGDLLMHG